jgi:methylenetetrahydrofolate reductase (NADPH)
MAGSVALAKSGIEPIYQVVTRDRNRIAIQSDLLGAASLGSPASSAFPATTRR